MRKVYFFLIVVLFANVGRGQVNYAGGTYTQDFNTLAATTATGIAWSNNSTLTGWYLFNQTSGGTAITTYSAETGTSNSATFSSYGATSGGTERAFGSIGSGGTYWGSPAGGAIAGWMTVQIVNTSGGTLNSFTINFNGEQWRNNGNTSAQTMVLEYGFGATFASVASWIAPGGNFDWASVVNTATAAAVNGNIAGLVSNRGGTVSSLTWLNGETLWIRWVERNDAGNDHALAIDDLTFSATSAATPSVAISAGGIGATSENQGATNVVLQRYDLAVTSATATINGLTVTTAGTYAASDLANLKVRYSADATLDAGDATLSTKTTGLGAGSQVFPAFVSQAIANGSTGFVFVTADIAGAAVPGNTINVDPTAFTNISFSGTVNKTGTDPVPAGGVKTFAALAPSIAITGVSPAAGNINQNSTNNILYSVQLGVTVNNATLNSVTLTTAGTYSVSDLQANSFKLWINSTNNLTGATQLGTGQAIVASGNTITFSGLSAAISSGTTRYILLTTDVAYNGTVGNTVSIAATPFTNIVFASGTKTGTDPVTAGAAQTITAVTPLVAITQTGPAASTVATGATNVILYTWNAAVTANHAMLNSASFSTAGTYVIADLVPNSFKLMYNTVNNFGTATQIGTSQAVAASGGTVSFTALSQLINTGTTGFFWVTADIDANATAGNTINIAATPFTNLNFTTATLSGTDPMAAGGVKTFAVVPGVGDIVINQFNPAYSGASDEYIELVNKTNKSFDLSTLRISYQAANGTGGSAGGVLSGILPPYSYWLLSPNATVNVGLTTSLARDGAITAGFAAASGQFSLQVVSTSTTIDALGYGTITGGTFTEGNAAATPSSNAGLKRNEGDDTNDNSADFTTVAAASIDLRNSSSRLLQLGAVLAGGTYNRINVKGNSSISGAVTATGNVNLLSGLLTLGANNLTTAAVLGGSATRYIITDGAGTLTINNVGASNVLFPVGPSAVLYHPATINNAGTVDNFSVRVSSTVPACLPPLTSVNAEWNITEGTPGGSNCTLTFDYNGASTGASYNPALASIVHCGSTAFHSGSVTGTVATGSGFYEFSPFGISSDAGVLPVLFGNVKASQQTGGIKINWSNMTESNIASYTIERSTDGYNFSTIATVSPSRNDGSRADYSYLDMTATASLNYYRIKANENGTAPKYSIIVKVSTANDGIFLSLYPNPVTGNQVSLQATALPKGNYTIRIFNATGQQVLNQALRHDGGSVTETIQLPAAIGSGMFVLRITGGAIDLSRSLIIK